MATEAQKQGIVLGKRYRVAGPRANGAGYINASGGCVQGSTVELQEDDNTSLPFFNRLNDDGSIAYKRCCINIEDTQLELIEEPKAEPAAVHVSLNGNSTTIVVQRNLTPDEVSAVLKAINQ